MTNTELRKKIQDLKVIIGRNLENWDSRTRSGMVGQQEKAKRDIEVTKQELSTNIVRSAMLIAGLEDAPAATLKGIAAMNPSESVSIDFYELEHRLIDSIYKGREVVGFTVNNEFTIMLNRVLSLVRDELGAISMPTVAIPATRYGKYDSKDDVAKFLHEIFKAQFGTELKAKYMHLRLTQLGKELLDGNFDTLTIVVTNIPKDFRQVVGGITKHLVFVTKEEGIPESVVSSEGDTEQDLILKIVNKIQENKLKGENK
jgi:hypothetical protein